MTPACELPYHPPLPFDALFAFLAPRAIPGVQAVTAASYVRSVRFGEGAAVVELTPVEPGAVRLRLTSVSSGDVAGIAQGARRLLDLDADPRAIDEVLRDDPVLAPLVTARPGLRLPGAFDGFELAVRAILGQQISVAAATTLAGRIVRAAGRPLDDPVGPVTHLFPTAGELVEADLSEVGLPARRRTTITALAEAVARGDLDLDATASPDDVVERLVQLPGIGPWTSAYIAMRALRDPDAIPFGDLGLRRAVAALTGDDTAAGFRGRAEAWRPWRGYAAMHLWSSLRAE
jgi:AraC family transcriptional regulator of adaptative response / DNA-3-methyladenine glycosylase II